MSRLLAPLARRRSAADDGMSVLEIVIAISILLFVMLALWSLMLASTTMGQNAKARALAVETANGYIEAVRAMPYAEVGLTGNDPTGTLVPDKRYTQGGFDVQVVPTVSWEVTSGVKTYKVLSIRVAVTAGTRQLATYTTKTYIRDRRSGVTSNVTEPSIKFVSDSPGSPENQAIVFGSRYVTVKADSSGDSPEWGVPLASIVVAGNDVVLTGSETASWTPPANSYLLTKSVYWDTTAWGDGNVLLVASAKNTASMLGIDVRYVVVDNLPPNVAPSSVTPTSTATNVAVPLQWLPSWDGTLEVPRYYLTIYQQGLSDSSDSFTSWAPSYATYETPLSRPGPEIPYTLSTSSFSRYAIGVKGCGPRWNASSLPAWTSAEAYSPAFYSRPVLTVGSAGEHSHTLSVSPPTFPATGVVYTWYRDTYTGSAWTGWATVATTTEPTHPADHLDEHVYRFRVKVDFTPTSGVPSTTGSQVITQDNTHDYAFSAPADWTQWW
jgi:Flp pilus assembly protein TadG